MLNTYMCAPGYHKGRAAEEHTGGPECTSIWDCAGRCALLLQGGTYFPKKKKEKKKHTLYSKENAERTLAVVLKATWSVGNRKPACQGWRVDVTRVRIQLWQVLKKRKGQLMTQQSTLAWLTCYTSTAGVNEFSGHVFVCSVAYVHRCLPAV